MRIIQIVEPEENNGYIFHCQFHEQNFSASMSQMSGSPSGYNQVDRRAQALWQRSDPGNLGTGDGLYQRFDSLRACKAFTPCQGNPP
jgi:hypothetical protein